MCASHPRCCQVISVSSGIRCPQSQLSINLGFHPTPPKRVSSEDFFQKSPGVRESETGRIWFQRARLQTPNSVSVFLERGSGGVQSTGVSQRVRATGRVESQSVLSPERLFKTRDLELPFSEGSLPSCSPHSVGYTRTSLHPYFPVAKFLPSPSSGERAQ